MTQCKHYQFCGRVAIDEDGYCILHSKDEEKDLSKFHMALIDHRKCIGIGCNFNHFVFPDPAIFSNKADSARADFTDATFLKKADFSNTVVSADTIFTSATFLGEADFSKSKFRGEAQFSHAKFKQRAKFKDTTFIGRAIFGDAIFENPQTAFEEPSADFTRAIFTEEAGFWRAKFKDKDADFRGVTFTNGADFTDAEFSGRVDFRYSKFYGRTVFVLLWKAAKNSSGSQKVDKIFSGAEVDFRHVLLDPLDGLIIRDADLRKCQFLGTDLRKAEITNATWPEIPDSLGDRFGVYDDPEVASTPENQKPPWAHIERLYRELKQNYEERRDYERASDFHFGEKEMRRRNPETDPKLRRILCAYKWVSGYGEKFLPPLLWLGLLWAGSTWAYLGHLSKDCKSGTVSGLSLGNLFDAALYALQVMTHLKPDYLLCDGWVAQLIHTADSILGPLLIGLFALALRQRLKR